jgi:alpha-D-ribose 1-methylphosphonate 5-triphosphate diphosphatase
VSVGEGEVSRPVPAETVFTNARIVTEREVVRGSLRLAQGVIAEIGSGRSAVPGALDCDGDLLIPGLVELHTDNLEKHYSPRIGVEWDPVAAAMAHDLQLAGAGITTVYDSLVLGAAPGWEMRDAWLRPMLDGLRRARAHGMLRIEHRLHLRCEVTHPEITALFESFLDEPALGFMSLMDHAPGDRQSPDIEAYKVRYREAFGMDQARVDAHVQALIEGSRRYGPANRRRLAALARANGIPCASHDDASVEHIEEAAELGCRLSEFPTTIEAARAARERGLHVLMGAPNVIRGGSHSGNIAASELVLHGLLDVLSSDYVPSAMLHAAVRLTQAPFDLPWPAAIAMVTSAPADAAGLDDRGRLAPGLRADLVRLRVVLGRPVVLAVHAGGVRVI